MATESALKTPGVYIREISLFPPSVAQVETAIPAFIGCTQKDDTAGFPTRITNLAEYEALFGKATPQDIELTVADAAANPLKLTFPTTGKQPALKAVLYYSVQMFYKNGGGPCYIVSAGLDNAAPVKTNLKAALDKLESFDEPTLIVIPDAVKLTDALAYELMNEALAQCEKLQDRFVIMDVKTNPDSPKLDGGGNPVLDGDGNPVLLSPAEAFRGIINGDIEKAKYGAAYFPNLRTTLGFDFSDDATIKDITTGPGTTLAALKSTNNELYTKIKTALGSLGIELPPSGAVAGLYADTDANRGVWKAPANVQVIGVTGPTVIITDEAQKDLNVDTVAGKSINAIRAFTGKGTLIWGARTLAGNDNEWRYVPVRRLFITVEESVKKASARFVFEPNDANTWTKVRAMIENYLTQIWRDGALAGAKPEQAFFVKVGLGQTMTAQDILEGKMIVEIGMAAVRPAEFIILRFSHKMQEA
jgi:phage tail sheath protein FI